MFKIIRKFKNKYRIKKLKDDAVIGRSFKVIGNAKIVNESGDSRSVIIGDHSVLGGTIYTSPNGSVKIGSYSYISNNVFIGSAKSISIGDYVGIAENTRIFDNNTHPVEPKERKRHRIRVAPGGDGYSSPGAAWDIAEKASITIHDNVWIGMNSFICKGVVVGEGSVIASNSVVTKNVPAYVVVAGNPARVVKSLKSSEEEI